MSYPKSSSLQDFYWNLKELKIHRKKMKSKKETKEINLVLENMDEEINILLESMDEEDKSTKVNPRAKKVYQYDLAGNFIKEYSSTLQAGLETGAEQANISKAARGLISTCNGYFWSYLKHKS